MLSQIFTIIVCVEGNFSNISDDFFFQLQWLKLDDLFEQERNIRVSMANRVGVLGLMLHQTVDHDPMNPIRPPTME